MTGSFPDGSPEQNKQWEKAMADKAAAERERERERPDKPYPQTVLPNSPNGKNEECYVRALIRKAELAAGFNFSLQELWDTRASALAAGEIREDSYVKKPQSLLERAFLKAGLTETPSIDGDPDNARGTIIELRKITPIDTGAKTVHLYETQKHYQSGNADGSLESDPMGYDISDRYASRKVYYVHY